MGSHVATYVTVSVKVPSELRERMRELDIKPSNVLRRALEEEVRRREVESVKEAVERLKPVLDRISIEQVVKSIRQDREQR